jgi:hypothetical protein
MQDSMPRIAHEVAVAEAPDMWMALSHHVQAEISEILACEGEAYICDLLKALQDGILTVVNLRALVGRIVERDKGILSRIFLDVGRHEFVFVRNSGFYFGFLFGLPQV